MQSWRSTRLQLTPTELFFWTSKLPTLQDNYVPLLFIFRIPRSLSPTSPLPSNQAQISLQVPARKKNRSMPNWFSGLAPHMTMSLLVQALAPGIPTTIIWSLGIGRKYSALFRKLCCIDAIKGSLFIWCIFCDHWLCTYILLLLWIVDFVLHTIYFAFTCV